MEDYGVSCIKYPLTVFNGFLVILGIVLMAVSCVDLSLIHGFAGMETSSGHETDAVLIAVGVLIIVVAVFGCFGAWKESPMLLYIFAGCLTIIILLELSVSIIAAALRPQVESTMKAQLRFSFIKYNSTRDKESPQKDFWDKIQTTLECCGVTTAYDYCSSDRRLNPPDSCCFPNPVTSRPARLKRLECVTMIKFYKGGCEDKVLNSVHNAGITVIVCGILFCFLEVAGIVLALWLAHEIKAKVAIQPEISARTTHINYKKY